MPAVGRSFRSVWDVDRVTRRALPGAGTEFRASDDHPSGRLWCAARRTGRDDCVCLNHGTAHAIRDIHALTIAWEVARGTNQAAGAFLLGG